MSPSFLPDLVIPDLVVADFTKKIVKSISLSYTDEHLKRKFPITWFLVTEALSNVPELEGLALIAPRGVYEENVQHLGEEKFCALLRDAATSMDWHSFLRNGILLNHFITQQTHISLFLDIFYVHPTRNQGMSHLVYSTFSTEGKYKQSSAQLIIFSELVTAVIQSWNATFRGNAADVLLMSISTSAEQRSNGVYARFLGIVNSAGTGKSRMIDQVAKKVVTIPICLRGEDNHIQGTL